MPRITNIVFLEPLESKNDKFICHVNFVICEMFVVRGAKLLSVNGNLFLQMPNRFSEKHRKYLDVIHPINNESREEVTSAVVSAYVQSLGLDEV